MQNRKDPSFNIIHKILWNSKWDIQKFGFRLVVKFISESNFIYFQMH